MKVEPSVETYQVGAHFKALIKAILVAPSRILENFFSFHVSLPLCESTYDSKFNINYLLLITAPLHLPKRDMIHANQSGGPDFGLLALTILFVFLGYSLRACRFFLFSQVIKFGDLRRVFDIKEELF